MAGGPLAESSGLDVLGAAGTSLSRACLALLAAACGAVLVVTTARDVRARMQLSGQHAALLAVAGWSALPVTAALVRTTGGPALLAALLLALPLTLVRSRGLAAVMLAMALTSLSAAVHPLAAMVTLASLPLLARQGAFSACAGALSGASIGLLLSGTLPVAAINGVSERILAGLSTAAAAPMLALDGSSRALTATGHDWLQGNLPVAAGLACWMLLIGAAALVGRFRNAVPLAFGGVLAAMVTPFVVPGWVPGDTHTVLCTLLVAVQCVALILAPVSGSSWPAVTRGLAAGMLFLAVLASVQRAEKLSVRRFALDIPHHPPSLGSVFAPELERDPLRLLLYMEDMTLVAGHKDPQTMRSGLCAERLLTESSSCLQHEVMLKRLGQLVEKPGYTPPDAEASEAWVFQLIPALDARLQGITSRIGQEGYESAWQSSADELVAMLPDLAEVLTFRARHPKILQFQSRALDILRAISKQATALGESGIAVPLRELLVEAQAREPRALAILGREMVEVGRVAEGVKALEEALSRMQERDLLQAVSRGALAWGRLLLTAGSAPGAMPELGSVAPEGIVAALRELDSSWSGLVGGQGADAQRLQQITPVESLDYWLVAELLLRRHEVVLALKDPRMTQTGRDVARVLEGPESGGLQRLPALWIRARLALSTDESGKALRVLREAREMRPLSLRERGDGAQGRLLHSRWRRLVLHDLSRLLEGRGAEEERASVATELQSLH